MFLYLCQWNRLCEEVVSVSLLQLFQRAPQQHQEGSELHLQCHLLNFNLDGHTHINTLSLASHTCWQDKERAFVLAERKSKEDFCPFGLL